MIVPFKRWTLAAIFSVVSCFVLDASAAEPNIKTFLMTS